jgi:hypothetical protein
MGILFLVIAVVISSAEGWEALEIFGTSSFKMIVSEITELEMALGIHDLSEFRARV